MDTAVGDEAMLPPPIPPGWYPDPWSPAGMRWWDGRAWTPYAVVHDDRQPHPHLPLAVAAGAIGFLGVPIVLSRFLLEPLSRLHWPVAVLVLVSGVVGYGPSVWWAWRVSRMWGSGSLGVDVGARFRLADLGWGPLTWLTCVFTEAAIAALILALDIPFTSNTTGVGDLRAERGYVLALLVLAVVVAPVVEEIVFRGLMLRGFLSRWPAVVAISAQALIFGAAHFDPIRGAGNIGLIMVLAGVGGVLGAAAYLTRRIAPTMIAHAILNAVAMAVVLTR